MHNLAIVLEHAMGCGPREALEVVARRIEARLIDFEELRRRVATARAEDGVATSAATSGRRSTARSWPGSPVRQVERGAD